MEVVPYIGTWIETPVGGQNRSQAPCRTLYRYVDWNFSFKHIIAPSNVVPYIGTWIETNTLKSAAVNSSRTLYRYVDWNRKCNKHGCSDRVVPYIGTWIETAIKGMSIPGNTSRTLYRYVDWNSWTAETSTSIKSRTLYRYVDWNTDVDTIKIQGLVVPYIGTWIETDKTGIKHKKPFRRTLYRYVDWNRIVCKCNKKRCGRTLYRYVDWNYCGRRRWSWKMVVPYIGTWIETWDG